MSGLKDSVDALERQLTGLQMQRSPATGKKIPPPPPPKINRAQPQVPSGATRTYSAGLSSNNNTLYGNMPPPPPPPDHMFGNKPPPVSSLRPPSVAYCTHYDDENHLEQQLPPSSPVSSNYSELMQATRDYQQSVNYPTYQNHGEYGYQNLNYESIYEPVEPRALLSQAQTYTDGRLQDVSSTQSQSISAPQAQSYLGCRNQISHSKDRGVSQVQSPTVHSAQSHHYVGHRNQKNFAEGRDVEQVQTSLHALQAYDDHRNQNDFSEDIGVPVPQAQYYSPHRNRDHYLEDGVVPCVESPTMPVLRAQNYAGHNVPDQRNNQCVGHRNQNFAGPRSSQYVQSPTVPAQQGQNSPRYRNQIHLSEECDVPRVQSPSLSVQQSQYHRNQVNFSEDRPVPHVQAPSAPGMQAQAHRGLGGQKDSAEDRTSGVQSPYRNGPGDRRPLAKEAEVDALTQLLVQSIGEGSEPDTYGMCVRCHRPVKGSDSGCTAMDQIYHVSCFTCAHCGVRLQGVTFYAVDGQPHCEQDYICTLEKCSVCSEPIKDRILRATGKPYHPACFVCVACGKSLDGIPFTVDAANQIHCIEDFHNKFAPRCCVCSQPIMPEEGQEETVRIVALDRSFHVTCYRCEDCGLLLSSEEQGRGCYPLDDHILCKACNARRIRNLSNVITTDL